MGKIMKFYEKIKKELYDFKLIWVIWGYYLKFKYGFQCEIRCYVTKIEFDKIEVNSLCMNFNSIYLTLLEKILTFSYEILKIIFTT